MFPDVGEFNLVVAGLATFAATAVGYACTRRLSTSSSSQRPRTPLVQRDPMLLDSDMQVDVDSDVKLVDGQKEDTNMEHDGASPAPASVPLDIPVAATAASVPSLTATTSGPERRGSLKRKVPEDGFDEPNVADRGYPYNLYAIYPNKRCRTPSTGSTTSTPSTPSRLTRAPSPILESTLDATFDAVVVSHMTVSPTSESFSASVVEPPSAIDVAPTPTTEPPISPSPVPSNEDVVVSQDVPVLSQEVKVEGTTTPARVRSPTPVPYPTPAPASPVLVPLALVADTETEKQTPNETEAKVEAEKPALPPALSPLPVLSVAPNVFFRPSTPKPFTNTGFAAFANQSAFGISRPTTPNSSFTSTSTSSGFAAFAGVASPFSAAVALNRPAAASSIFSTSSTSFFRLKPSTNTNTFFLPNNNIFGSGVSSCASSIFGANPTTGNIFGKSSEEVEPTELLAAEKFLDDVLGQKKGTSLPTQATEEDPAKEESDSEGGAEDTSKSKEETEEEVQEREQREKEEKEREEVRRAARARVEEEVRQQEAREKQVRKEAKRREREAGHALVEAKVASLPQYKYSTGEEDENTLLEQKGLKLYIKRGERPFSEAISGLVRVLAHRTTTEERILFRREPTSKISMNVRVQPTVRVTYVPDENVLRCILKETVSAADAEGGVTKQEVAIYAIKPGRSCSKQDFKSFAEALMQRSQFNEGAERVKAHSA